MADLDSFFAKKDKKKKKGKEKKFPTTSSTSMVKTLEVELHSVKHITPRTHSFVKVANSCHCLVPI